MPTPELTPEEQAAILQIVQAGDTSPLTGGLPETLPVVEGRPPPMPPGAAVAPPEVEPPAPPDQNDPHNRYMGGTDELEELAAPAPAPAPAPAAPIPVPKVPPPAAAPPKAAPTDDRVVSTKPDWYESIAPPETSAIPGVVGGLGMGLLGALLARKDPAVAAGLGGLGGLAAFSSIAGQPQREYENKLSAAERQAAMHAKLSGGDSEMARERARVAAEKWAAKQDADARKLAEQTALRLMDSPETIKERQIAHDMSVGPDGKLLPGGFTDSQLGAMNGEDIRRWRTGLQQQAGQARGADNSREAHDVRTSTQFVQTQAANEEWNRRHGIETETTKEKEVREQDIKNLQADIPGLVRIGKVAPNADAVNMARTITDAMGRAHQASTELMQLREKLNAGRVAGNLYKYFANDPEGKQALTDAQFWQKNLMDAQRELSKLGVLQGFEKAMIEETNPAAGSLQEYFTGQFNYNTYMRNMPKVASRRLKAYGYAFAPDSEYLEGNVPAHAEETNVLQDLTGSGKKTMGEATDNAVKVGTQAAQNAAGNAQRVAGAVTPAAQQAAGVLRKIRVKNAQTGQWMDAQKAETEINATIEQLKARGINPSDFIQMVP